MKSKTFIFLFFFLFLLVVTTDFRIINELRCCQDDFDYYSHALTISQDFDFDYSNQITTKARFYNQELEKVAPMGFFGSGLLAAPFLFIGVILDQVLGIDQEILNFKKLFYSFSSIFYLFGTSVLLHLTFKKSDKKFPINLVLFGYGITYYAFERLSMTHVYEDFTISLVIYLSEKYYDYENLSKKYSILIPVAILLSFLVRWTNYYVVAIPFIVCLFRKKQIKTLLKDVYFLTSCFCSVILFALHTKAIYGYITFSPIGVYGAEKASNSIISNITTNFVTVVWEFLQDIIILLTTFEFGLFWFTPVVFLGFTLSTVNFLFVKKSNKLLYFLILLSYAQCFFIISIWNSTASSYGFRYAFSLIPLSIYIIYKIDLLKLQRYSHLYLTTFSILGFLGVVFFETTSDTQLSLMPILNSFGIQKIYSQPDYLIGLLKSFFVIESYLKILATSLLGAFIIKLATVVVGYDNFNEIIFNLGYSENVDLVNLITKVNKIEPLIFIVAMILSAFAVWLLSKTFVKN